MNLEALNWLIKTMVWNFSCSDCSSKSSINDINIKSIENSKVILDVKCPSCQKISSIRSEVMSLDLKKLNLTDNQLNILKSSIDKNNSSKLKNIKSNINDNFIVELNKNLKKENITAMDLLWND